jgi:hypothetical protein
MFSLAFRRATLALAAATLLSMLPLASAEAQHYHRRGNAGAAVAGGVVGGLLGGLAAGAIISSARPAYAGPVYAAPPAPVYVEPEPVYEHVPTCYIKRRKVWLDDYSYTFRHVRVCD